MPKRVTLKDIAAATGLTVNTISRALSDKEDISEATRQRIKETAGEMGYVGDVSARSLRSGSTKTIAVIIGDISNPFFGSVVKDVEKKAGRFGYTTIIYNTEEDHERERAAIISAFGKRVDGILICPVCGDEKNIGMLTKLGLPFVLMGRYIDGLEADCVCWDDVKAGMLAAGYLIDRGHTNILYIGAPEGISTGADRLKGYLLAHEAAGLPPRSELIRVSDITAGSCEKVLLDAINERRRFTGIVAFSDLLAYEALRVLRNIPDYRSIPVVGIDDIQSRLMLPMIIPSVGCSRSLGECSTDVLLKKLADPHTGSVSRTVLDVVLKTP